MPASEPVGFKGFRTGRVGRPRNTGLVPISHAACSGIATGKPCAGLLGAFMKYPGQVNDSSEGGIYQYSDGPSLAVIMGHLYRNCEVDRWLRSEGYRLDV